MPLSGVTWPRRINRSHTRASRAGHNGNGRGLPVSDNVLHEICLIAHLLAPLIKSAIFVGKVDICFIGLVGHIIITTA